MNTQAPSSCGDAARRPEWQCLRLLLLCCVLTDLSGCLRFQAVGTAPESSAAAIEEPAVAMDPELAGMLNAARRARIRGDIDHPKHDSALGWLRQAMHHAPGHAQVREERRRVLHAGVREALEFGHRGDFKNAELLLTRLQQLGMSGSSIEHARRRLARLYQQRSVTLVPPAHLLAGSEPDLVGWLSRELARYSSYTGWLDLYAKNDRQGILLYRQLQRATPGRKWHVRLLHADQPRLQLHYRVR